MAKVLAAICFGGLAVIAGDNRLTARAPTEIVIVATVHAATPKYSSADLLAILRTVRPKVVLFEYPVELMTSSFEFKNIDAQSLEQRAVLDYVKESGAGIRPYDIDGRNAYFARTKFFERQQACNQALTTTLNSRDLAAPPADVGKALRAANARRDAIGEADPATINSFASDAAISEKQWMMNEGIPEILRLTNGSPECTEFWDESRAFWIRRNDAMVHHIQQFAQEFAGERIVVLCGFEHRYYLRSHLYNWEIRPSYVVKEYWTY